MSEPKLVTPNKISISDLLEKLEYMGYEVLWADSCLTVVETGTEKFVRNFSGVGQLCREADRLPDLCIELSTEPTFVGKK